MGRKKGSKNRKTENVIDTPVVHDFVKTSISTSSGEIIPIELEFINTNDNPKNFIESELIDVLRARHANFNIKFNRGQYNEWKKDLDNAFENWVEFRGH